MIGQTCRSGSRPALANTQGARQWLDEPNGRVTVWMWCRLLSQTRLSSPIGVELAPADVGPLACYLDSGKEKSLGYRTTKASVEILRRDGEGTPLSQVVRLR